MRGIAKVVTAVATGDSSQKFVVEAKGEIAALADTINSMTDSLRTFADQVTTVAREVGIEGKLGGQARVPECPARGESSPTTSTCSPGNLTNQVRNIALVTTAVANGDLSQKITVEAKGEILELKSTVNVMVDQLRTFASEVTRIAKEVGTEGKLGAQADIKGVAGTWKDLTDNVNLLAGNLTNQVAQHRAGDDGRRQGRLFPEDHRRGEGRNPRAQKHRQYHGRAAARFRSGSDARCEGSRERRAS